MFLFFQLFTEKVWLFHSRINEETQEKQEIVGLYNRKFSLWYTLLFAGYGIGQNNDFYKPHKNIVLFTGTHIWSKCS